ncbi:unnamed protein product [Larinioides sclopetarius]|uniref:Uncharacterized protein n=1 Tax=Larinioides sclopetarius TaxID=280406 RepID=A0AAV2AMC7_9ARAC
MSRGFHLNIYIYIYPNRRAGRQRCFKKSLDKNR